MMWQLFTYSDECLGRARGGPGDDADNDRWLAVHICGFDFALTFEPAAMIIEVSRSSMMF